MQMQYNVRQDDIVLINPPSFHVNDDRLEQNLGLAYIASYLKKMDIQSEIIELTGYTKTHFETNLKKIPVAGIYGISCMSTTYKNVKRIISYIRKTNPLAYICVGGPHATARPEETLNGLSADSIVTGEGEIAFHNIVKSCFNKNPIKGVIPGIPVENLDGLPFPERESLSQASFTRQFHGEKVLSLLSSRGCRFRCLHCNSIIMGGGAKAVRFRSTANIMEEIRYLKSLGYSSLRFNDDNFADNPNLEELLTEIGKEKIRFRIFSHLQHLTQRNLESLIQSGCDFISIGIESLNKKNLSFLGKGKILDHLDKLKTAKELGIIIRASFMVGLPFDTDETIKKDFEKAVRLGLDEFAIYPLLPYPGTRIGDHPKKYGYEIINPDYTTYFQLGSGGRTEFTLRYNGKLSNNLFSPADVKRWYNMAHEILSKKVKHMRDSKMAR